LTRRRVVGFLVVTGISALILLPLGRDVSAGAVDPRLTARLDKSTARAVQSEVDRARTEGLPTEPLVLKALEGAAKGASGRKITTAVRRHANALGVASRALGPATTEAELVAGAGAILAGAAADSLRSLRTARGDSSLVIPLVVISDLLARRVPAREAEEIVVGAWRAGMSTTDLLRLREGIHRDIQDGMEPSAAALRARATTDRSGVRTK